MPRSRSGSKTTSGTAEIRAYLAALPPRPRQALKRIRAAIRAAAPDAVDAFSYRMPATRLDGKVLVWYAAFTNHVSLFPIGAALRRALAPEIKGLKTSTGTIQFPLEKPVPVTLVRKIVKARVAELRS